MFRVVFGGRGHDLHVGVAMLQVEAADQVTVGFDAVRVVDVGVAEEALEVRLDGS